MKKLEKNNTFDHNSNEDDENLNIYKIKTQKFFIKNEHLDNIDENESDSEEDDSYKIQKVVTREVLENNKNAKISSLIRKRFTFLLKQTIANEDRKTSFNFSDFFRKLTKKVYLKIYATIFQGLISFVAVLLYIISTYYPSKDETNDERLLRDIENIQTAEFVVGIIITIDYIFSFVVSKNKIKYLYSPLNLLDLCTVVPTYLSFFELTNKSLGFLRIFRIVRIMRVFKLQKLVSTARGKTQEDVRNEAFRRLVSSLLTILAIVFLSTGIIHFLTDSFPDYFSFTVTGEKNFSCSGGSDVVNNSIIPSYEGILINISCPQGEQYLQKKNTMTFDKALYYMVITMSTVGYGDVYPNTEFMRLVVAGLIIISLLAISRVEVNDFLKLNSQYTKAFSPAKGNKHLILAGFFTKSSLNNFLSEFFHEDHKEKCANIKIVIIQDDEPNKEIQSILLNPKFDENIRYLQGDIFNRQTLDQAKVNAASAIILKSDSTSEKDSDKNDQYLILATKALSQITKAPIYVQFNHRQALYHDWADWDLACSSQQIKMSIIIKNGFIPGFSAMIMNLTSSISSNIYSKGFGNTPWILEYMEGASQELYIVEPPEDFEEIDFAEFVVQSYVNFGTIPLGIRKQIVCPRDHDLVYFTYVLNPINYKIKKKDQIIVISGDEDEAMQIFRKVKKKNKPEHQKEGRQNTAAQLISQPNMKTEMEENIEYLQENFRVESYNLLGIDDNFESTSNVISNGIIKIQKDVPAEFTKKKKLFRIWEADKNFLSYLEDHYLVFCKEDQLEEFANCFYSFFNQILYFVSEQHPGSKWEILKMKFKQIVCIESSYSDIEHLNKLHLNKCKHCYILTYAVENSNVKDSGILPLVKIIEENYEKCKYTLELADELNVRYLSSKGVEDENIDEEITSGYDTKTLVNIKSKNDKLRRAAKLPVRLWPKYAKSDIFFSSSLDSLLAFSYHSEGSLDIIMNLLGIQHGEKVADLKCNSSLSVMRYIGNTLLRTEYETIVRYFLLLDPPLVPIAIYRYGDENNYLQNEMSYIVTNPKKDLELNKYDQIICIGKPKAGIFSQFFDYELLDDSQSKLESSDESFDLDKQECEAFVGETKKEELELLTEEQLLERLKNEVNYFNSGIKHDINGFVRNIADKKKKKVVQRGPLMDKLQGLKEMNQKREESSSLIGLSSPEKEDEKRTEVKFGKEDEDEVNHEIISKPESEKSPKCIVLKRGEKERLTFRPNDSLEGIEFDNNSSQLLSENENNISNV